MSVLLLVSEASLRVALEVLDDAALRAGRWVCAGAARRAACHRARRGQGSMRDVQGLGMLVTH
eukprot:9954905-Alexandrium_andersonii.AAC.1